MRVPPHGFQEVTEKGEPRETRCREWVEMGLYDKRPTLPAILLKSILIGLWALGVGGAMALAMRYEATPGRTGSAEPIVKPGREVVMIIHPDCPCTGASVRLFQRLLSGAKSPIPARLFVVAYGEPDHDVAHEPYAKAVPAARASWITPEEAKRRFGAYTSGHTVAYLHGKPVFSGGLTSGRGVESSSDSQIDLKNFLAGKPVKADRQVFGCALDGDNP
jgi:hypothetical protein